MEFKQLKVGEYFRRRKSKNKANYEEEYWGTIIDPDGNERDRHQERDKYLSNFKQEIDYINGLTPGKILDVGCGLGYLLSGLNENWDRGGIEISAFAAKHAQKWGKIHVGDLQSAEFFEESYDVVSIMHVIEHIDDPIETLLLIKNILKKDGKLIIATPDFDSGCARLFGDNYRLLHDDTHVSMFTNDSMHRFLRDHGFEIERVEYPFFDSEYFTEENLMRLFDTSKISPPFYGNFMTFYSRKK